MKEDEKPFPTMLFVNEVFLHASAVESSEIKREDDQSATRVIREECEFDDIVSSHWNQDVVLLKIEKKEKEHNLSYDSTWIKCESEIIQVDTDSDNDVSLDDDNIEIKVERNDSSQVKYEIQVDTDSLISNDYSHTKVDNDESDGICPMKSEIGQNQTTSPDCYEIKLERDEEEDISFNATWPTTNTDSSLVTSMDMPTNRQLSKAGTVSLSSRMGENVEGAGNHFQISDTVPNSTTTTQSKETSEEKSPLFTHSDDLKKHLLIHTGEKPHKCTVCHKTFTRKCKLNSHMLVVHTSETNHKSAAVARRERLKAHPKCHVCGKAFNHLWSLKEHMLIHTGDKHHVYKASIIRDNLKKHMWIHTCPNLKCSVCDKAFDHMGKLKAHMWIHTRPNLKCSVCDKAYDHMGRLKAHMLIHTRNKHHVCSFCNKAFTLRGNLTTQTLSPTGDKCQECTVCGEAFTTKETPKDVYDALSFYKFC